MIIAEFFKKDGLYTGFSVSGHAEYADKGEDIVCASVSSAIQYLSNTLTECFHIKAEVKVLKDKIQLKLPQLTKESDKMLEGLYLHLTILSEDFEGTIKITTSEV